MLIEVMIAQTVELSTECSQSLVRRQHRLSQAKVRATTQGRGSTSRPFAVSELLISLSSTLYDFDQVQFQNMRKRWLAPVLGVSLTFSGKPRA
jgi:hypothetical protein